MVIWWTTSKSPWMEFHLKSIRRTTIYCTYAFKARCFIAFASHLMLISHSYGWNMAYIYIYIDSYIYIYRFIYIYIDFPIKNNDATLNHQRVSPQNIWRKHFIASGGYSRDEILGQNCRCRRPDEAYGLMMVDGWFLGFIEGAKILYWIWVKTQIQDVVGFLKL